MRMMRPKGARAASKGKGNAKTCSAAVQNFKTVTIHELPIARSFASRKVIPLSSKMLWPTLQSDKGAVLAAVAQNGSALEFASKELQADKEVVLAAVAQDGTALRLASWELKSDKEVVLVAVAQDGIALWYASEELEADKEVVLAAVAEDGCAL